MLLGVSRTFKSTCCYYYIKHPFLVLYSVSHFVSLVKKEKEKFYINLATTLKKNTTIKTRVDLMLNNLFTC